jgi:hypothetical protein
MLRFAAAAIDFHADCFRQRHFLHAFSPFSPRRFCFDAIAAYERSLFAALPP